MTNSTSSDPSGDDAANRRWRLWASVGAGAIVVVAVVIGFFVISSRGEGGVTGALGLDHVHDELAGPAATAPVSSPPTEVAWTAATLQLIEDGDGATGRTLALQTCAGCHGETGNTAAGFPNLAGQPPTAIFKQLRDYASGHRTSPVMTAMTGNLTEVDMANLAAYFAAGTLAPTADAARPSAAVLELVLNGDPARGLPPCASCHAARGGPVGTPPLAGQPAAYLEQQLAAFATGARGNDIYGLMRAVAAMLTPAEVTELAAYYGN